MPAPGPPLNVMCSKLAGSPYPLSMPPSLAPHVLPMEAKPLKRGYKLLSIYFSPSKSLLKKSFFSACEPS